MPRGRTILALLALPALAAIAPPATASTGSVLGVEPAILWPPDHRLVGVTVSLDGTASCETPTALLRGAWSSEEDDAPGGSDGRTTNDIQAMEPGSDFLIFMRAERDARGAGRTYTLVYEVSCADGSGFDESVTVFVPHDRRGSVDPLALSVDWHGAATDITWNQVPGALSYEVMRGRVAALQGDGSAVDLGPIECLGLDGRRALDSQAPAPGEAFFYLVGYHDGASLILGTERAIGPRRAPPSGCSRITPR